MHPGEVRITTNQRVVTAAGTPEQLREAPEYYGNKVVSLVVTALLSNTGNIYITRIEDRATITTTGDILAPGDTWKVDVSMFTGAYVDLAHILIDAAVNGEGVSYTAIEVQ